MPTVCSYRYYGLVLGVTLWLGSILLAPWLESQHQGAGGGIYAFFSTVCHQEPDRCFFFGGRPLAVCARCTGLYTGFWMGLLIIPHIPFLSSRLARRPRLILWFFLPMAVDLLLFGINTHWSRMITGAIASFPISVFVWWGLEQIRQPVIKRSLS